MSKIRKTRTFLFVGMAALAMLAACSKTETTILVPEFVKDPVLLKKTQAACGENPGEMREKPNCINASNAKEHIRRSMVYGRGLKTCYKEEIAYSSIPDAKCVDEYFAKQAK